MSALNALLKYLLWSLVESHSAIFPVQLSLIHNKKVYLVGAVVKSSSVLVRTNLSLAMVSNVGDKFPSLIRLFSLYNLHFRSVDRSSQSILILWRAISYTVLSGLVSTPDT